MIRTVDPRTHRRSFEDDAPGQRRAPPDRGGGLGAWTIFLGGVAIAAPGQDANALAERVFGMLLTSEAGQCRR